MEPVPCIVHADVQHELRERQAKEEGVGANPIPKRSGRDCLAE